MSRASSRDLAERVNAWFEVAGRPLPWRDPATSAWGILVSEFMAQQTQVSRVVPLWETWMARWPTPADLAAAPPAEAIRLWANLGYPRRALWLHRAAEELCERHGGEVPNDLDALLALQGVGPYTARAVLAFAFGESVPVVDTNTRRVIARAVHGMPTALAPAASRDLADMAALLPWEREAARAFNVSAMELGATLCRARDPQCGDCPIVDVCAWVCSGRPAAISVRPRTQPKYEGSDRQARGVILRSLRTNAHGVAVAELSELVRPVPRFEAVLAGLVTDGLVVVTGGHASLPY
ncbi:MAG TPA: A/G-specific adenine glycosylase [Candidatus Lumbricidophila sp.]|nr:A/G-specific adenine glycosylase [Candidatus Lumbricidophila sp.]